MMRLDCKTRNAARWLASTLAFGGSLATLVLLVGAQDLESYDHAFVSLDRGTAVDPVRVLGQPVFTLALGLGVRLPLHGSLGASPAAALAPYVPAPLTYWLLIALSIGAAAAVVRHALEPLGGRLISWLAAALLFCSLPIVNYTIVDDWPETAVTYCACVACVFAPHALLALQQSSASSGSSWRRRHLGALLVAATVWGLVGAAHPGYWPLLAGTVVLALTLSLCRSEYPVRARLTAAVTLGAVAFIAVAPQTPDIVREINAAAAGQAGELRRIVDGPRGGLMSANLFPFRLGGARDPFTFLVLALVSLLIGLTSNDADRRRLIVGSALLSVLLGIAAATIAPSASMFAPSNTWTLRDPALALAILSAAAAAGLVRGGRAGRRAARIGPAIVALAVAGLQGPVYAVRLVVTDLLQAGDRSPWTHDLTSPDERVSRRGLPPDRVLRGERLALWPGAGDRMRNARRASVDFADAGYLVVTVWTKQRTMRGLLEPNDLLFNQTTELGPEALCDPSAIRFLQLRYLLLPPDVDCPPWSRIPGVLVDGWLQVGVTSEEDDRVRALPVAMLAEPVAREPAFSPDFRLRSMLIPLSGTSLTVTTRGIAIRLDPPSVAAGRALVLPVAYDPAWRASSGQVRHVGGLVALVGVEQRQVAVDFVPDTVAVLRALSMTVAQLLTVVGLLGLGYVRPL